MSLLGNFSYFNLTVIVNCSFSYSTATGEMHDNGGAISVRGYYFCSDIDNSDSYYDPLVIVETTLVGNSALHGGGIYCSFSKVFVKKSQFLGNTAKYKGGGIYLERSQIFFTGNISLKANKVTSQKAKGGALYYDDNTINCDNYRCPILWTDDTKLSFVDNKAEEGPILFGGILNWCNRLLEKSFKTAFKEWEFSDKPYNWSSYAITSSGNKLCFSFSCTIREVKRFSIKPGQEFAVTVACVNQLDKPLNNCVVNSYYDSTKFHLDSGESKRTINGYEQLLFHLYSNIINGTNLTIYSDLLCRGSRWNEVKVFIDVQQCSTGFYLYSKECSCDYRLHNATKVWSVIFRMKQYSLTPDGLATKTAY